MDIKDLFPDIDIPDALHDAAHSELLKNIAIEVLSAFKPILDSKVAALSPEAQLISPFVQQEIDAGIARLKYLRDRQHEKAEAKAQAVVEPAPGDESA